MQHSPEPTALDCSHLTQRWLSAYYACCQDEGEETHPGMLTRVIPAVEAAMASSTMTADNPTPTSCAVTLDLTRLYMTMSGWVAALRSLARVLPLRRLLLRDTNVGDAGLRTLAREVATAPAGSCSSLSAPPPPCLEVLDLSGAGITDAGPLSLLVSACPRLVTVNLAGNHLGTSPNGLALFCAALQLHSCVDAVDLSHNYIHGTRGGAVVAGLAELIVVRSLGVSTPAAASVPLRSLDLSHNLLGSYYMTHGGLQDEVALAKLARERHHGARDGKGLSLLRDCVMAAGSRCLREGCDGGGGLHETVTDFPLLTALNLNNSLTKLDLRDNGLPDALLGYVEAKLHVNRRTQDASGALSSLRVVPVKRVDEILETGLRRALQRVRDRAAELEAAASIATAVAEPATTMNSTDALAPRTPESPELYHGAHWTTGEVQELLRSVVHYMAADLSIS